MHVYIYILYDILKHMIQEVWLSFGGHWNIFKVFFGGLSICRVSFLIYLDIIYEGTTRKHAIPVQTWEYWIN